MKVSEIDSIIYLLSDSYATAYSLFPYTPLKLNILNSDKFIVYEFKKKEECQNSDIFITQRRLARIIRPHVTRTDL